MTQTTKRRGALASQKRGQTPGKRGQSKAPKRRQGGRGKPFEKGQPDLPGKRFGEGQPANQGGRPRASKEVKDHIQVWGIEMADTLHDIFSSIRYEAKDRIAAIRDLRDWGYGRPKQAVEISGPDGAGIPIRPIEEMNSSERRDRLIELAQKAGAEAVSEVGAAIVQVAAEEDGGDDDAGAEGL